ncbi:beta-N-acetylhexosaminidase [Actinospica sp. MGRD01-02]|uniref:beta-N-acetylhexosaminidase n=1 Tax=Actinospica acidithermotolerans TaxID=2828514 RepID=A0A941EFU9_9ACTN|nr:beta-N-acetylhexosaminidase [Actinospica acidithermotolerans]MBR7829973.1 beta-N-acetylhexosaminidase [Actinospica acidithermotolerans]
MLLPRPTTYLAEDGEFSLTEATVIRVGDTSLAGTARWLQSALRAPTGLPLLTDEERGDRRGPVDSAILLSLKPGLGAEAYELDVDSSGVRIAGGGAAGVFYGCQALLQLLPPTVYRHAFAYDVRWSVPAVSITDGPRFRWRGTMLDVSRHFMVKREVLRFIDLMAVHRLNTLHLHLTDDQGWRVEILRYPKLTSVGGWRRESQLGAARDAPGDGRPHGGFYTQADIREIVAYAAERHITVVPEIDIPGHSQAAIAAYPELGIKPGQQLEVWTRWGVNHNVLGAEESTIEFYKGVLDELMDLFPGELIGLGGDECPKDRWEADERTQQLIRERGLGDEKGLQTWFISELSAHVAGRGRRAYGWDEMLEGANLPAGTVIASWRGMTGAVTAANRGYDVVACPDHAVYLDYRQSESPDEPIPVSIPLTVEDTYGFEPVPEGLSAESAAHVLGGQANVWTEHIDSPRMIDFYVWPRLCAIAEALWTNGKRDYAEFRVRLDEHLARLDALGVEYRHEEGPLPWQKRPGVPGRPSTREQRAAHIAQVTADIRD